MRGLVHASRLDSHLVLYRELGRAKCRWTRLHAYRVCLVCPGGECLLFFSSALHVVVRKGP